MRRTECKRKAGYVGARNRRHKSAWRAARKRGGKEYAAGGLETYSENEKRSGKKRSKACGGQQYAASGKTGGGLPVQAEKAAAIISFLLDILMMGRAEINFHTQARAAG